MNKLLSIATAGILALALNGFALAADESKPGSQEQPRAQPPEGSAATTTAPGGDLTEKEQEYLSALKKCEPMTGGEKTSCVEATKRQFGQK